MSIKSCARSAVVVGASLAAAAALAQHGSHIIITPKDLKWEDVAALPPPCCWYRNFFQFLALVRLPRIAGADRSG